MYTLSDVLQQAYHQGRTDRQIAAHITETTPYSLSHTQVNQIRRGRTVAPQSETIQAIAEAFDYAVTYRDGEPRLYTPARSITIRPGDWYHLLKQLGIPPEDWPTISEITLHTDRYDYRTVTPEKPTLADMVKAGDV